MSGRGRGVREISSYLKPRKFTFLLRFTCTIIAERRQRPAEAEAEPQQQPPAGNARRSICEIHLTIFQLPAEGITHLASVCLYASLCVCVCRPFGPPLLLHLLATLSASSSSSFVLHLFSCLSFVSMLEILHMWHLLLLLFFLLLLLLQRSELATVCR